ncbi:hypothetical protein FRB93_010928 [Tulasnella sp. JGI-2019a]|nr:hypothetical protein FRB93_010928 [Tulasnella sp. JGI-2019a]
MQDLKRNICGLDPSLLNSEIEDLDQRVRKHIPLGLRYACMHVAVHVSQTPSYSAAVGRLVKTFAETSLMTWLEVLSLIGRTNHAVGMAVFVESWCKRQNLISKSPHLAHPIDRLKRLLSATSIHARSASSALYPHHLTNINRFIVGILPRATVTASSSTGSRGLGLDDPTLTLLYDFRRFVMMFMDPITASSAHIYYSALSFTPRQTALSRVYGDLAADVPKVIRGRSERWSRTLSIATKHSGAVECVLISPDGKTVVTGSKDKTVRLWDARTGAPIGQALEGHTDEVFCLAISPDRKTVVPGSKGQTARVWDATTGAPRGEALKGHTNWVTYLAISPDGRTIVSGSWDSTMRLWDIGQDLNSHIGPVRISPDRKTIVSGFEDKAMRLWDASTGAPMGEALKGHNDWVSCLAISPDGRTIVSGSSDSTVRLWDASTGAPMGEALKGHTQSVSCLAISPDGKTIVSGSLDSTVRLWDASTGAPMGEALKGHTDSVSCLAISPDGRTIVSGSSDRTVRLWDPRTGAPCLALTPDGNTVIFGSKDNTVRLWDATTGAPLGNALKGLLLSSVPWLYPPTEQPSSPGPRTTQSAFGMLARVPM